MVEPKTKKQPPSNEATMQEVKRLADLIPQRTAGAIVSVIDRDPHRGTRQRQLAGTYRVVHGSFAIAVPRSERLLPDGTENEHLPKQIYALPGDTIFLDDIDAADALDRGTIEPLDARPSRVGAPSAAEAAIAKGKPWDWATLRELLAEQEHRAAPNLTTPFVGPARRDGYGRPL